jgi:hypothetical protein
MPAAERRANGKMATAACKHFSLISPIYGYIRIVRRLEAACIVWGCAQRICPQANNSMKMGVMDDAALPVV